MQPRAALAIQRRARGLLARRALREALAEYAAVFPEDRFRLPLLAPQPAAPRAPRDPQELYGFFDAPMRGTAVGGAGGAESAPAAAPEPALALSGLIQRALDNPVVVRYE